MSPYKKSWHGVATKSRLIRISSSAYVTIINVVLGVSVAGSGHRLPSISPLFTAQPVLHLLTDLRGSYQ